MFFSLSFFSLFYNAHFFLYLAIRFTSHCLENNKYFPSIMMSFFKELKWNVTVFKMLLSQTNETNANDTLTIRLRYAAIAAVTGQRVEDESVR